MELCVVGSGYVGLVTGVCLASTGQRVTCVDTDAGKIARLRAGEVPIYEPGLEPLLKEGLASGRLRFTESLDEALQVAEVAFVAVGTPPTLEGGADLGAVEAVAKAVAEHAVRPMVLVLKSTVPVGTNARVHRLVQGAKHRIEVVSNPEFLKEGAAVPDFMHPDRIIVGLRPDAHLARRAMASVYHPLNLSENKLIWMNPESAELSKYAANTMLAMRISFMNELAVLCEEVGGDIQLVRKGLGSDPRIGPQFLHAGPGYGGSCFPKDVRALVATGRQHGVELQLADATHRVNTRHRGHIARRVKKFFGGDLHGKRIAIWGLAFKPNTDDVRESPALIVIEALLQEGAAIAAHDPKAMDQIESYFGDQVELNDDPYGAATGAHALVLLTEWREYQNPDFDRLKSDMAAPNLFDGRNIWSSYGLRDQGFEYSGIGIIPS